MRRLPVICAIFLLPMLGCAYNQGSLIRKDLQTVYIPIFGNDAFERGLEFDLTEALVKEIQRKSGLTIVSDPSRAQTELKGLIFDFERNVLNENSIDLVRELQITVTLRFTWTDLERRKMLVQEPYFRETAQARFEIGDTVEDATEEALRKIAQRIVERLESSW